MKSIAAVAALIAALVLSMAAPATADSWHRRDPARDVVKGTMEIDRPVPAPHRKQGDIRSMHVDFTKKTLRMTVRFRGLTRKSDLLSVMAFVEAPRSMAIMAFVDSNGRLQLRRAARSLGPAALYRQRSEGVLEAFTMTRCRKLDHHVGYGRNFVRFTIPAACLGSNPRWAKVSFASVYVEGPMMYLDLGLLRGAHEDLRFSRRIFRG